MDDPHKDQTCWGKYKSETIFTKFFFEKRNHSLRLAVEPGIIIQEQQPHSTKERA